MSTPITELQPSDEVVKVYKIGGNVIDDAEALSAFLEEFSCVPGRKILIHGGGREGSRYSRLMGLEPVMIDGRRVTDADALRVVTMVYAGLVNKRIVAALQGIGCDALGLSGADAGVIRAVRRKPAPTDYGFVGDIPADGVDARRLMSFMDQGLVPVICAITYDGRGGLLNSNADGVASAVSVALTSLAPVDMYYCFENKGVLTDINDPDSVVSAITPANYAAMRSSGVVSGGMVPKVETALKAVRSGVRSVIIRSSRNILMPSGTTVTI